MIGPALGGLLIAAIGTGWLFVLNFVSYGAVIASLLAMRVAELHRFERAARKPGSLLEGFAYVRGRPDLVAVLAMLFLVATFVMNFSVYVAAMAVTVFAAGAGGFGLLRAVQTFMTTANSTIQLWTEPAMRGRVMAIYMSIVNGCTLFGAPLVGWVVNRHGARWSLMVGATAGLLAAVIGVRYLVRHRGLRVQRDGLRMRFLLTEPRIPLRPVRLVDSESGP